MIAQRPAEEADWQFVISTWSRSYKGSRSAGLISSDDWADVMHRQIRRALALPGVRALVAFDAIDPSFLYGWIAGDASAQLVHYVYVKEAFRRAGVARGLFMALGVDPSSGFSFTCWTPACARLAAKIPSARHRPDLARDAHPEERPPWT